MPIRSTIRQLLSRSWQRIRHPRRQQHRSQPAEAPAPPPNPPQAEPEEHELVSMPPRRSEEDERASSGYVSEEEDDPAPFVPRRSLTLPEDLAIVLRGIGIAEDQAERYGAHLYFTGSITPTQDGVATHETFYSS